MKIKTTGVKMSKPVVVGQKLFVVYCENSYTESGGAIEIRESPGSPRIGFIIEKAKSLFEDHTTLDEIIEQWAPKVGDYIEAEVLDYKAQGQKKHCLLQLNLTVSDRNKKGKENATMSATKKNEYVMTFTAPVQIAEGRYAKPVINATPEEPLPVSKIAWISVPTPPAGSKGKVAKGAAVASRVQNEGYMLYAIIDGTEKAVGFLADQTVDSKGVQEICPDYSPLSVEGFKTLSTTSEYKAEIIGNEALINGIVKISFAASEAEKKLAKQLSKLGIPEDIIEERNLYLDRCGFSEVRKAQFWDSYAFLAKGRTVEAKSRPLVFTDTAKNIINDIVANIQNGYPQILIGAPGTGKDTAIMTVANLYDMPYVRVNANGGTDVGGLFGETGISNDNGVGITAFEESALIRSVQEGCFFILDEANAANEDQLLALNELSEKLSPIPLSPEMKRLYVEPENTLNVPKYKRISIKNTFRLFLTINENLAGTKAINDALWTRLSKVRFPAVAEIDKILVSKYPRIEKATAKRCKVLWDLILKNAQNEGFDEVSDVCTRNFEMAVTESLNIGTPIDAALAKHVISSVTDADTREGIRKLFERA